MSGTLEERVVCGQQTVWLKLGSDQSDGEQWVTDRDGASEESEEVITKQRM